MKDNIRSHASAERFRLRVADVDHPAIQVTMPLISINDYEVRCIGTAFAVAPGLAITAEHVVDDWLTHQERRDGYRREDSRVSVVALQLLSDGRFVEWTLEASYRSSAADIAFLQFVRPGWWGDGPDQTLPRCARLNFNPPRVGDEVRVFGFPGSKLVDGILEITPSECVAKVCDVHMKGDGAFRPMAYIDIEGEILPGMSGGPCFDREGNALGVNAKGWQFQEELPPLSYVALLWPAMSLDIDLFKSGAFPAIELFNHGPARALGYERIFVTSTKQVHIAKASVEELKPIPPFGASDDWLRALNFAASNAKHALAEVRIIADQSMTLGQPLDVNAIHNGLRRYFWELEAALTISVNLSRQRIGLDVSIAVHWDDFVLAWRNLVPGSTALDELGLLNFAWYSKDQIELRTFAGLCRCGVLHLESLQKDAHVIGLSIGPCIVGSQQTFLPDGLTRFYDACRKFVQRLLTLAECREKTEVPDTSEHPSPPASE